MIYYIAQIVAALAILGTLYYGVRQIETNNQLARVNFFGDLARGYADFNLALSESPERARVWGLGSQNDASLSNDEKTQFSLMCYAAFYSMEGQYNAYAEGWLPELLERGDRQLALLLSFPGVQQWWPGARMNFSPVFANRVDELVVRAAPQGEEST